MSVLTLESIVQQTALSLLKTKQSITTLEVKNEARSHFPNMKIFQSDVSDIMDEMAKDGKLIYSDIGTHRLYELVTKTSNIQKLNRTGLNNIILSSAGKFLTISWIKKNGDHRTINGNTTGSPIDTLGYITLKTNKGDFKRIDTRTIYRVSVDHTIYELK